MNEEEFEEFKVQIALGTLNIDSLYTIAKDPNTSKEVLKILSKHKDCWVKFYVYMNPYTPKEIMKELYNYMHLLGESND